MYGDNADGTVQLKEVLPKKQQEQPNNNIQDLGEQAPLLQNDNQANSPINRRLILATAIVISASVLGITVGILVAMLRRQNDPLVKFLTQTIASIEDMNNKDAKIPTSFFVGKNYWEYICQQFNCKSDAPEAEELLTQRILTTYGANIYDGATYEIALAIKNEIEMARNQVDYLVSGYTADANKDSTTRAISNPTKTPDETFTYGVNKTYVTEKGQAYSFRMNAKNFINSDPLNPSVHQSWVDWKPISGENAWARFIGPLHVLLKQYGSHKAVPLDDPAILDALNLLPTLKDMQAPIGAIYYTTTNVAPNQGSGQVNPYLVSLENNMSMLAGIQMLYEYLLNHANETYADGKLVKNALDDVQQIIKGIVNFLKNYAFDKENGYFYQSGLANDPNQPEAWMPVKQPFAVDVQTWGITVLGSQNIDNWFGKGTALSMWNSVKEIAGYYANGDVRTPVLGVGYSNQPAPVTTAEIDVAVTNHNGEINNNHSIKPVAIFKDGSKAELMDTFIEFAQTTNVTVPMYSNANSSLAALQFVDSNNNQVTAVSSHSINQAARVDVQWQAANIEITQYAPLHDILSAEWTFGAMTACAAMRYQAQKDGDIELARLMAADIESMRKGVDSLRTDKYETTGLLPVIAQTSIPSGQQAYLYANIRYDIPFGWTADPIPSTCSTAWAIMVNENFNPFKLTGNFEPVNWDELITHTHNFPKSSAASQLSSPFGFFKSLSDEALAMPGKVIAATQEVLGNAKENLRGRANNLARSFGQFLGSCESYFPPHINGYWDPNSLHNKASQNDLMGVSPDQSNQTLPATQATKLIK